MKSLKNIVNHNFVVAIGLPYCYLPFKVIFRTNYFHEIVWPTSHVLLIVCTKTKLTTTTNERQSSYNQNNFIILMKFNRNNVGIEDNFQVSSFTAFRLNNRMSTNMCDTTVKIQSICLFPRHEITRDDPSSSRFEI